MTDELMHKWRENKKGDKFDIEDFKRAYLRGKAIIQEARDEGKETKQKIYHKIEDARLKLGLKPSKKFGGA
jgi:hypothetical protein